MGVSSADVYYDGSRAFTWLADLAGLPIDQMNFLVTQFSALGLAALLRSSLSPRAVSPATRHAFGLVLGLFFGYFSFGKHAVHLAGLPALCYVVMRTHNPRSVQRAVLFVALLYLSCIHFHRQVYDYGSYTLDITGPLMVITQKVTSLAYSVHDGMTRKEEELTPSQRYHAVKKMPTALEYFAYALHFQALMAGPVIFYRDYIDFIGGHNIYGSKTLAGYTDKNLNSNEIVLEPSPRLVVVKKVLASCICAVIFVSFIPSFPIQKIKEDDFIENTTLGYKVGFLMVSTMLVRFKYYHAWLFADAICNNSGLGFNGYNVDGTARWDLISNVNVLKFETALSLRDSIEQWNKGTNRWLRMIVYERIKTHSTILTYALSALWHGFYPGYYLTFAGGALFTFAARSIRRHVRPYFLGSNASKLFYDTLTFVTTRVFMAYVTFSFILLEFYPSIRLYLHMYLAPHISALAVLILLPKLLGLMRHQKITTAAAAAAASDISTKKHISNGHGGPVTERMAHVAHLAQKAQ
ncbi:lysophospholipid acyltransferase 6 isoform X1 [Neodiprion lecontei]|uniref:Lysophospholipid acyltransferase 6 isoform X1 n=1 Tax=Neodiprion lecontei TaxID=441921 RepID=A0A6J0BES0_NEOLC|nr:lysophospholipid acyltransferase 6 isoform X1 [Neodiprion lecontei]